MAYDNMTDEQWQAIYNKDASYDGKFYYGVKTTHVVCKPSCTSRNCKPENVVIFENLDDAVKAGYRMCLRCRPDNPDWHGAKYDLAERTRKLIEDSYNEEFSLDKLAGELYVNKSYLLRVFKEITGYTPLHYHNKVRCDRAMALLEEGITSIADIGEKVGFASASHFTRVFKNTVGMTPSQYAKTHREK